MAFLPGVKQMNGKTIKEVLMLSFLSWQDFLKISINESFFLIWVHVTYIHYKILEHLNSGRILDAVKILIFKAISSLIFLLILFIGQI